ncbi:MAG: hypothetical protein P8N56_01350 [Schleiferiaceae bacterium]|nr:hypothetical protein [Schleiferiaceae bacterium]
MLSLHGAPSARNMPLAVACTPAQSELYLASNTVYVQAQGQAISMESRRWPRWLRRILNRRGSSGNRRPGGR